MSALDLAQLLRDHRDSIVARFVADVQRKDLSPAGTSRSLIADHIPKFLDEIAAQIERTRGRAVQHDAAGGESSTARRHGEQRWTLGYDLRDLVREYGVLRHCILAAAKETSTQLTLDNFDVLATYVDAGIAEAATEYIAFRDAETAAQKANLEFVAEAGQLLTSSLDYRSTLSRLASLLVPRMADWCAVHLDGAPIEEMPITHVDPTKIEAVRDIYRRHPPADATRGYVGVINSGQPVLVSEIDAEYLAATISDPEQLEMVHRVHPTSWIIVPLSVQGKVFGALTLAYSDSARRYGKDDLTLGVDLARRAAVAIDNARLYELSQNERTHAESATRAKDELVAMISHELRTPLNAMMGWIHLMKSGSLSAPKYGHALDVIDRNAQAQRKLIEDLLDISRVITGKIRLNPTQVDFSNVIEMAVERMRPAADAKRITIQLDLDRTGAVMRGDPDRLQQVVANLLSNAVKFTPKGGAVRVRLERVDSDLALSIEDNGQGVAGNFLGHIFESFRQSDGGISRPHGGLGIGLSIAKYLVELHGGTIEAQSPGVGKGTTFVVKLPVSAVVSTTLGVTRVPVTSEAASQDVAVAGGAGLRVLVVDDEEDARELLAMVFESCGIEVRTAASAPEARSVLEVYEAHAIISDIGMPDEDGYALIRSIRMLSPETKRNIPAIALTAFARVEDRSRALVEGFNLHLTKPLEPAVLVRAVIDLVGPMSR